LKNIYIVIVIVFNAFYLFAQQPIKGFYRLDEERFVLDNNVEGKSPRVGRLESFKDLFNKDPSIKILYNNYLSYKQMQNGGLIIGTGIFIGSLVAINMEDDNLISLLAIKPLYLIVGASGGLLGAIISFNASFNKREAKNTLLRRLNVEDPNYKKEEIKLSIKSTENGIGFVLDF
jgi:hypothetical protein